MTRQAQVKMSPQVLWGTLPVTMRPQESLGEPQGRRQARPLWRRERRRQAGCKCSGPESGKAQECPQSKDAPTQEPQISQEQACFDIPVELHWKCGFSKNVGSRVQLQRHCSVTLPTVDPRGHFHSTTEDSHLPFPTAAYSFTFHRRQGRKLPRRSDNNVCVVRF